MFLKDSSTKQFFKVYNSDDYCEVLSGIMGDNYNYERGFVRVHFWTIPSNRGLFKFDAFIKKDILLKIPDLKSSNGNYRIRDIGLDLDADSAKSILIEFYKRLAYKMYQNPAIIEDQNVMNLMGYMIN